MSRRKQIRALGAIVATAILSIAAGQPASAADLAAPYDPGFGASQQKVDFGTGWYIRGDVGFEEASVKRIGTGAAIAGAAPAILFDQATNHQNSYVFSGGGGYKLNDWFRFDAVGEIRKDLHGATTGAPLPCQIGYIANSTLTAETPVYSGGGCSPQSNSSLTRYDVLANAYVDLGTWSSVTPYVGVGAGAAFGRVGASTSWHMQNLLPYQVTFSDALNSSITYYNNWDRTYSSTYVNFAWALMAGVAIDVADHVKLDIGYRYFNGGHVTIQSGNGTSSTSLVSNEIRAGIRYMVD